MRDSGTVSLAQSLAYAQMHHHFHACAFVMGPTEEQAIIEPFLCEGMKRGEKALYIVDPERRAEHDARLRRSAPSDELLDVTTWNEAHLKGGDFSRARMMAALDEMSR